MTTAPATVPLPDRELDLVERHRLGDPAAFEEVYALYERMVYNLALRMTGDPEESAELTQEVFLRVHRHLGRFRGGSTLKTWLFRIALNCCRSRLRRRRLAIWSAPAGAPDPLDRVPDERPGPEGDALQRDLGARLTAALAALPLVFREAVVLRDVHGFSYDEIARLERVRIGTVRSRIARGRERLRRMLEDDR